MRSCDGIVNALQTRRERRSSQARSDILALVMLIQGADPDWLGMKGPEKKMKKRYPINPDWSKANDRQKAGPVNRPRPAVNADPADFYGMRCNIVLPTPGTDVLYVDGSVYEILAPGTAVIRNDSESLIWRGLYQARRLDQPTGT